MPLLLSEKDVRVVLSMEDLISVMETALDRFSSGAVKQPLRSVVEVANGQAFYGVMPAFMAEPAALGSSYSWGRALVSSPVSSDPGRSAGGRGRVARRVLVLRHHVAIPG